jgi:tetratricopeptide (TPR) repeat protein
MGPVGRLVLIAVLAASSATSARYLIPEIKNVPASRLVRNLELRAEARLEDVAVRVNLARLHGMAYALDTESVPVKANGPIDDAWYGAEPKIIPYNAETKERAAAAAKHLNEAIRWYEAALALDPTNLTARLGLGWSLDQKKRGHDAIAAYRRVIEEAWPKEQKTNHIELGQNFYTVEAAGYLIPLLDAEKDGAEIAELKARLAKIEQRPRAITPLVIPLGAVTAPADLVDMDAAVLFDADGTALPRRWTWISRDAAWLVHDPTRSRKIESALQLFGNVTFWLFWRNGFEPLAALDDDRDGEVRGAELRGLAIWHDRDGNGVSESGEVRPIEDHAIVCLRYAYEPADGFLIAAVGRGAVRFADGRQTDLVDVILRPARRVS